MGRDAGQHIGVQGHFERVSPTCLERAVRHADGGLVDVEALGSERLGDVGIADGAEQAAVHAGLAGDGDGRLQLVGHSLGGSQLFGSALEFGATGFELGQVGGVARLALPCGIRKLRA
jgi:hypothetical protein